MGMNLYVVGVKPADDKTGELEEEIDLETYEWDDEDNDSVWGLDIDVADIPEWVMVIRAYVSC
jgi:hypothetical protein